MKVTIHLAALTRLYYDEEIEVPDKATDADLDKLVSDKYDEVDGGDYSEDLDWWERGECYWTKEEVN
jgi:hypothetical protein